MPDTDAGLWARVRAKLGLPVREPVPGWPWPNEPVPLETMIERVPGLRVGQWLLGGFYAERVSGDIFTISDTRSPALAAARWIDQYWEPPESKKADDAYVQISPTSIGRVSIGGLRIEVNAAVPKGEAWLIEGHGAKQRVIQKIVGLNESPKAEPETFWRKAKGKDFKYGASDQRSGERRVTERRGPYESKPPRRRNRPYDLGRRSGKDRRQAKVETRGAKVGAALTYTDRTRKVLKLAEQEAKAMGHSYVGTEHLLLGLLVEGEGIAAAVLKMGAAELSPVRAREIVRVLMGEPKP